MKQGFLRVTAASCLLIALGGCPATSAPKGQETNQPTTTPAVTSLAINPSSIDLNAPYSLDASGSQVTSRPGSTQVAGYPTTGQFTVSETGGAVPTSDVVWTSSAPDLVVVDGNGVVQSVNSGTSGAVTITATLQGNPRVSATASVNLSNDGKASLVLE